MNAPPAVSLFNVPGMRCAGCIAKIETSLGAMPGVIDARVNFTSKRVRVAHLEELDAEAIRGALRKAGFAARPMRSVISALKAAAEVPNARVLICGSLYLAGDVLAKNGTPPD